MKNLTDLEMFGARLLQWLFVNDASNVHNNVYYNKCNNTILSSFTIDGKIKTWNEYYSSSKLSAYKHLTSHYQQAYVTQIALGKLLDDDTRQERLADALDEVRSTEFELNELLTKVSN